MTSHEESAESLKISASALEHVLQGVVRAASIDNAEIRPLLEEIASCEDDMLSMAEWHIQLTSSALLTASHRLCAGLVVGIAFLRECYLNRQPASAECLASVWDLVQAAITSEVLAMQRFKTTMRAEGALAVPLCTLKEEECIVEEFFLNVWSPDGHRSIARHQIYTHPYDAFHWILAGEAKYHTYNVDAVSKPEEANYCEGTPIWTLYDTHSTWWMDTNGHRLLRTSPNGSTACKSHSSYDVPAPLFHSTEVPSDVVFATICRLAQTNGASYTTSIFVPYAERISMHLRVVEPAAAIQLGKLVGSVREWESLMAKADQYAQDGDWEHALKALHGALSLCDSRLNIPTMRRYRYLVIDGLGFANRCLGKFEQARDLMEDALVDMDRNSQRVGICAELGVVYIHLECFEDAKRVLQDQYDTAKEFGLTEAMCRAVGNLGVVNYRLAMRDKNLALMGTAIDQLNERIDRARKLSEIGSNAQYARTLEAIGLARLSLCYTAQGKTKAATSSALESLMLTENVKDFAVVAISRFFYGRALLYDGFKKEALDQFNTQDGCTCTIAFSKEPSPEHSQFLLELANCGADFNYADAQGYTALDYAVFNNNEAAEEIILDALSKDLRGNAKGILVQLKADSMIRKGYREIFQDKMRPILMSGSETTIRDLRLTYLHALNEDKEKCEYFDPLKFVAYQDFLKLGRFPRSTDGVTRYFSDATDSASVDFIIFFSYRWINSDPWANTPDDVENTQYSRTLTAVQDFLQIHTGINTETLGIWIDFACIDQDSPMLGVAALPMVIAQCDAVISLVDGTYYDRAWCSMEVMMIQALRRSSNVHSWFEHVSSVNVIHPSHHQEWSLKEGSIDFDVDLQNKHLRYEDDRMKIQFLERQCKLLC